MILASSDYDSAFDGEDYINFIGTKKMELQEKD